LTRNSRTTGLTRRAFLGAGGAVVVCLAAGATTQTAPAALGSGNRRTAPTPWVAVTADNTVVILVDKCEMGQGVRHLFASIFAEELGLEPADVHVEEAPVKAATYGNGKLPHLPFLPFQMTGGSTSTADAWEKLRPAAANMRRLLVAQAARHFATADADIELRGGRASMVSDAQRHVTFRALLEGGGVQARSAATKNRPRRSPDERTGPRVDTRAKVTGHARFGIDVDATELGQKPLIALVLRPDRPGDSIEIANRGAVEAMRGVRPIVSLERSRGLAIVADSFWHAYKARRAVVTLERKRTGRGVDSAEILRDYRAAVERPGADSTAPARDPAAGGSARILEETYETPYGGHAPMEPMTAACVRDDRGTYHVHAATQFPQAARAKAARALGVADSAVEIHGLLAGGSFGRRVASDFIVEVAEICRASRGQAIKLIWTREDDFRHDYLRPCAVSRVKAVVAGDTNTITSWEHSLVSESPNLALTSEYVAPFPILGAIAGQLGKHWRGRPRPGVDMLDPTLEEGLTDTVYAMRPTVKLVAPPRAGSVQVGYWRSVGCFHTIFTVESMIDELAAAAGCDPLTFRRRNLEGAATERERMRWCLDTVAGRAGAADVARRGTGVGIACFSGFDSFAALAVRVTVERNGARPEIRVGHAWAAVDCGLVINPDVLRQQVEGGIIFGLSAALKPEITIVNGIVQETNFHACDPLRMHECPTIDVEYQRDDAGRPPTGVGELMVPLAAPAVANAVYNLTGRRLRQLPLALGGRT
jgi:isoquinoline 1-oxidoreductase/isoquinoline 1-oxidoreductase beta subunit